MAIPRYRSAEVWPLLSAGFRPFFLVAGLWAVIAMAGWLLVLQEIIEIPTAFTPVTWHSHELLFGYVAATIAGFLLTAIPNWTGRMPLQGWPLGSLVLLWMAGRIAVVFSAWTGPVVAAAADISFLVAFAMVIGREIVAGRNWRNLPVVAAVSLLAVANALIHAGTLGGTAWEVVGMRLALAIVIMLISLVGGRIIPSFTANWLRRRQAKTLPSPFGSFDQATLAISAAALAIWVAAGLNLLAGTALILAALAQAVRLVRWRGADTRSEPLLWILHLGYAWLPLGFALLGLTLWVPSIGTSAIHAFTAGAMGTMTLAVMTRASLGHSKRELTAGNGTTAIYLLALLAGLSRVIASAFGAYAALILLAAVAWIAAFTLFIALYLPLYVRR
jgi:uncharacterized protein involved in response to NO